LTVVMMQRKPKLSTDAFADWTIQLTKYFDHVTKSALTANEDQHIKFLYYARLCKWNYAEGLLDRAKFFDAMKFNARETVAEDVCQRSYLLFPFLNDLVNHPTSLANLVATIQNRVKKVVCTDFACVRVCVAGF
jgi:hypothetical protein